MAAQLEFISIIIKRESIHHIALVGWEDFSASDGAKTVQ
jgi:hypothetical protein